MKIKVVFKEDIRLWRTSQDNTSFEAIDSFVRQSWPNDLPENYSLTFTDDEGDQITISNDTDLHEAIQIARDDCRTSLKVRINDVDDAPDFIVLGSRDSSESDDDMYDAQRSLQPQKADIEAEQPVDQEPQPDDAPTLSEKPMVASMDDIHVDTALAVMQAVQAADAKEAADTAADAMETEEKSDPAPEEPADDQPEDQPTEEQPSCLKTLAQQFFSDEGIVATLPDMIDVLFEALRKGDTMQTALDLLFGTFPVVHEHKFVQHVLPFLPAFLPKLQSFAPFILLLGPEVVKQHVKQLLELVQRCMGAADDTEVDISPIMRQCCPNLIKLMEAGLPSKPNGSKCSRSGCNFLAHTRQGHGFCCWRCKHHGAHGGRCEQAPYNNHEQTVGVEQLLGHFGMAMPDLEGRARAEMQPKKDGPVVHQGVTCDGCGVSPIVGARFKSAVIADYDLCADCEAKGVDGHPREYPMIKFGTTMQSLQNMREQEGIRFKGMGEFWWQSKKGQCGGRWGGWRHGRGRGRGRRHRGRGGGCPFKRWARPDWAADRANQMEEEETQKRSQDEEHHKYSSTSGGWGHHGGWGGPYHGGHGHHGPPHHGPGHRGHGHGHGHGCPPWVARKMAWLEKMQKECGEGNCPPWLAKKMAWFKSMAERQGSSQTESSQPGQSKAKLKAAYLKDVNIPDRSVHASDLTLIKTWQMRNTGSGAWKGCYLQFVKGDKSLIAGIEDTSLNGRFPVANAGPNSVVEVSATIQTPKKEGRYCAYFRLHAEDGTRFGPQIWVDIRVSDDATAQRDIDMTLRPCQIKRVEKNAKKVAKLDGLRRKLHKKLEKLERKEKQIRTRAEDSGSSGGKPKKVAKLERKADNLKQKMAKVESRLENVSVEREERAAVIEQLYAAPTMTATTNEQDDNQIATAVEGMSIEEDAAPVQAQEPQQPTESSSSPMVAFQYQTEFEQVMRMGFDTQPNVIRYLLTENKGNVGAVVNNLLAAS